MKQLREAYAAKYAMLSTRQQEQEQADFAKAVKVVSKPEQKRAA